MRVLNGSNRHTGDCCSITCRNIHVSKINKIENLDLLCTKCNKKFTRTQSQVKKSKNLFCSQSCAASYNNMNKKYGIRRSKLETCLEYKLLKQYPNLDFHFNQKNIIESELDIYIPSRQLAFEINGILHYEAIYGKQKLFQIQSNDCKKATDCRKLGIQLHIIDTRHIKHISEQIVSDIFSQLKTIIDKF